MLALLSYAGHYSSAKPKSKSKSHAEYKIVKGADDSQSWALSVFFKFFDSKKRFFAFFFKVNNLFLHQSYLKSPLSVKLT